jgi:hypothetical protein
VLISKKSMKLQPLSCSGRSSSRTFGGIHSHSIIDDSTPTESLLQMEQTCIITTALMEFL